MIIDQICGIDPKYSVHPDKTLRRAAKAANASKTGNRRTSSATMASSSTKSGGDYLAKRSGLTKSRGDLPMLKDILIVDDETFDADRLKATLRLMFGYDIDIRRAATLGRALDEVIARMPELIFLDDVLKPSDNASQTLPFLRRTGYVGPVIVVSGQVTRQRRTQLIDAGAADVIHKDDVDSVRVAEALHRVFNTGAAAAPET